MAATAGCAKQHLRRRIGFCGFNVAHGCNGARDRGAHHHLFGGAELPLGPRQRRRAPLQHQPARKQQDRGERKQAAAERGKGDVGPVTEFDEMEQRHRAHGDGTEYRQDAAEQQRGGDAVSCGTVCRPPAQIPPRRIPTAQRSRAGLALSNFSLASDTHVPSDRCSQQAGRRRIRSVIRQTSSIIKTKPVSAAPTPNIRTTVPTNVSIRRAGIVAEVDERGERRRKAPGSGSARTRAQARRPWRRGLPPRVRRRASG